jgi:hypothetical protein
MVPAPPEAMTGMLTASANGGSIRYRIRPESRRRPCWSAGISPASHRSRGPLDGVDIGRLRAGLDGDDPAGAVLAAAGVDCQDDALAAKPLGGFGEQFGVADGGGVDGTFVGAAPQEQVDLLGGADPTADGEGDEDIFRDPLDEIDDRLAKRIVAVMSRKTSCRMPSSL